MNEHRFWRIVAAVFVAPLTVVPAVLLCAVALRAGFPELPVEVPTNVVLIAVYGVPLAFAVVLAVGVPLHLVLSRTGCGSVAWHTIAGVVTGIAVGFLLFEYEVSVSAIYLLLPVVCGAAVAGTFGAVAGRRARSERP